MSVFKESIETESGMDTYLKMLTKFFFKTKRCQASKDLKAIESNPNETKTIADLLAEEERKEKVNNGEYLETHKFHAKRFKMMFWGGSRTAKRCFSKCYRTSYKFLNTHCLVYDMSFYKLVKIKLSVLNIVKLLEEFFMNFRDYLVVLELRSTKDIFYANLFIDPVVLEELQDLLGSCKDTKIYLEMEISVNGYTIFELLGPNSLKIVKKALSKNYDISEDLGVFERIFYPKSLPQNCLIDFSIRQKEASEDPIIEEKEEEDLSKAYAYIINKYCKKKGQNIKIENLLAKIEEIQKEMNSSEKNKTSPNEINQKKKSIWKMKRAIPILIKNSSNSCWKDSKVAVHNNSLQINDNWNSLKLITLSGCASELLISLKNSGAKPIGFKERNFVLSQNMRRQFPTDFPGTKAFLRRQLHKMARKFLKYSKLCQKKRKDYKHFQIASPFNICPSLFPSKSKKMNNHYIHLFFFNNNKISLIEIKYA